MHVQGVAGAHPGARLGGEAAVRVVDAAVAVAVLAVVVPVSVALPRAGGAAGENDFSCKVTRAQDCVRLDWEWV
jgi:hypothetical protein